VNAAVLRNERVPRIQLTTSLEPPEFTAVLSSTEVSTFAIPSERQGFLHGLRIYVGAALAGSVLSGLALGWLGHHELVQIVGALVAVTIYAAASRCVCWASDIVRLWNGVKRNEC